MACGARPSIAFTRWRGPNHQIKAPIQPTRTTTNTQVVFSVPAIRYSSSVGRMTSTMAAIQKATLPTINAMKSTKKMPNPAAATPPRIRPRRRGGGSRQTSAVVLSMTEVTRATEFAGKPPRVACSRTVVSSGAM